MKTITIYKENDKVVNRKLCDVKSKANIDMILSNYCLSHGKKLVNTHGVGDDIEIDIIDKDYKNHEAEDILKKYGLEYHDTHEGETYYETDESLGGINKNDKVYSFMVSAEEKVVRINDTKIPFELFKAINEIIKRCR